MPVDTALIEAVLVPIPGDAPAGKDLRYDPRYDQVKEARREDLDLPTRDTQTVRKLADYAVVMKVGRELLTKETKDLQLAAWLTEALLKREGLIGLATGLTVVQGILDTFWEGCFPAWDEEDPELRAGPLEWMGGKFDIPAKETLIAPATSYLAYQLSRTVPTESEVESNKEKRLQRETAIKEGKPAPEVVDRAIADANKAFYKVVVADATAAAEALNKLEKTADERFGRDAPSMMKLRGALDDIKRTAGSILAQKLIDDPDPIVEEVVDEGALAGAEEGGAQSPEPTSPADAARRIAVSATFLRKLTPTNPAPYLMLRGLRWGELRAGAATGELDPRLLEAPPTATRARLKTMMLDGKWPELLELCESVMATPQGRGWLDLQRYCLTACEKLGSSYDAVASALRDELRTLLSAIPQLKEMTLMDDTPTANAETQTWLEEQQLASDPVEGVPSPAPESAQVRGEELVQEALAQDDRTSKHGGLSAGPRRRAARDPFDLAKGEVAQGRAKHGIEILLAEISREQSPRGRFLRQTQLAYVMVESNLDAFARPILERLVATIDERKLEDWESGPLVAQPLALLCRVMDRANEGSSNDRKQLYLRICRLDAMQAMALSGG